MPHRYLAKQPSSRPFPDPFRGAGTPLLALALEPRFMFDAAGAATGGEAAQDAAADRAAQEATRTDNDTGHDGDAVAPAVSAPQDRREVAFVSSGLQDWQDLVAGLDESVEVVVLDAAADGLAQIAAWAETHSGYDALHILSHGTEGRISLGSLALTAETVEARSDDLATVGAALAADGDILVYGCNVAAGDGGALLDALASATGADVAASTDATGGADAGGNWTLEAAVGTVETASLSLDGIYPYLFVTTTYSGSLDESDQFYRPWTPFDMAGHSQGGSGNSTDVFTGDEITLTSESIGASNIYNYAVATFIPDGDGVYTFWVSAANVNNDYSHMPADDTFMSLYEEGFDPDDPLNDLIYANDDRYETSYGDPINDYKPYIANVSLTAGTAYAVVITAYDCGATGTFTYSIEGPYGGTWYPGAPDTTAPPTVDLDGATDGYQMAYDAYFQEGTHKGNGDTDGVTVTNGAWMTDADGDALSRIVVTLGDSQNDTGERLLLTGTFANVDYTLDSATRITITNTGSATYAEMAAALDAVRYQNSDDNPDTTDRTVTIAVTDDGATPKTTETTTTVHIGAANDPPTDITLSDATVKHSDGTDSAVVGTLSTTDPDSASFTYTFAAGDGDGDNGLFSLSSGGDLVANAISTIAPGVYSVRIRTDDGAGNTFEKAFSITVVDDRPAVVTAIAPAGSPAANASSVDYTVTFDEAVDNVTADDFALTATGTAAGVIGAISGMGTTYTVTVHSITGDGTLRLDLSGGTDVQAADANSVPAYTAGTSHTVDRVAPTVTDGAVTLSGATGSGGTFKAGDTVSAIWDNSGGGDNNADPITSVSVDFSAFGGGLVAASESGGIWTATYTLTAGDIDATGVNVSVSVTDDDGNTTTLADTANASVDTEAPTLHWSAVDMSGNTGSTFKVGDTITVTWNNSAGGDNNADTIASVSVDFSDAGGGTVTASESGGIWTATYTLTAGAIDSGATIVLSVTDDADNTATESFSIGVDTLAPTVTDGAITISGGLGGTFKTGDTVTVTWDDTTSGDNNADTIASVAIDFSAFGGGLVAASESGGVWTATYTLIAGVLDTTGITARVVVTDDAGNTGTAASPGVAVDTQAPGAPTGTLSIDENSANGAPVGTVSGGGADGVTYSLTDDAGGRFAIDASGAVTVADGSLLDHETQTSHTITVRTTDDAGNTTDATVTVTILNVNEAPSLGGLDGARATVNTGGAATALTQGIGPVLTDPDDTTLASATIRITGNLESGEDVLDLVNDGLSMGNIAGSYDTATGTLTLTSEGATATLAQWATALSAVTYRNTDATTAHTADRTVTWTVTDDDGAISAAATSTVGLTSVPAIDLDADDSSGATGGDYATTFTEDAGDISLFDSDLTIDEGGNLASVTVTLTNRFDSGEDLRLTGDDQGLTVAWDGVSGRLTITGEASPAAYETVLRGLRYHNDADAPDTTPRTITVTATDADGNTSAVATTTLAVVATNDAPTLTDGAEVTLTGTNENTVSSTTTVSTLLAGVGYGDGDGPASGLALVATVGNGTWQYSMGGATWTDVGAVSASSALLLDATAQLRYVPDGDDGETATLSFRAWDQTSGTASADGTPQTADTTTTGGATAFSAGEASATLAVSAVNDAPTLTDGAEVTLTGTDENTASSTTTVSTLLSGAGYGDVDDVASGLALIATVGNGTWQYSMDGTTWTDVGAVSASSALLLDATAQVRYVPDGDNGETTTLSFRAWDQSSGTASADGAPQTADTTTTGGATAFSAGEASATLSVSAVNDAPELTGTTVDMGTTDEDTAIERTVSDFLAIADVDTGALSGLAVTGLSGNGTWTYSLDGVTWLNVGSISETSALLLDATARVRYEPDGDNGETATLSFRAWDQTSGTPGERADVMSGGGTSSWSAAAGTLRVTATDVNDAPVATGAVAAQTATAGMPWHYVVPPDLFQDVDAGDTLTWTVTTEDGAALPGWLAFDADTRTLSGIAPTAEAVALRLTATDGHGAAVSVSFTLTAEAPPEPPHRGVRPSGIAPAPPSPPSVPPPPSTTPLSGSDLGGAVGAPGAWSDLTDSATPIGTVLSDLASMRSNIPAGDSFGFNGSLDLPNQPFEGFLPGFDAADQNAGASEPSPEVDRTDGEGQAPEEDAGSRTEAARQPPASLERTVWGVPLFTDQLIADHRIVDERVTSLATALATHHPPTPAG